MRFRFLLVVLLVASPLAAQAPHADWRTVETETFRIHYPAPWEEWALYAARRVEDALARVEAEVGFEIEDRIDVLVMDPYATANGSAWPFIGWPRMVLWTNPPPPESVIGANRDWIEVLTVHEIAHLAHLLRPSRNPMRRALQPLLPISPIALSAPRWATEGYATLIEGELTGTGRPNSDFRAAVLRRWAQQGRLPSYSQLHADTRSWMGMSMAYLVGSAYLEWLRDREGEESLRNLWVRATARQTRSFDEAFRGVYGDTPEALYRRFSAELTAKSIQVEDELGVRLREGALWQDLTWTTEPPDVSADGERLVTILRKRGEPSRMVVYETAPDEEGEKKYQERIEKILERDPEDVAPVRRRPLPREPLYEKIGMDGAEPSDVRFLPGAGAVLFVRFEPDPDGFLHPDLFVWDLDADDVRRVTRGADLRDADPAPDSQHAVAIRNQFGKSQVVLVDLRDGSVEALTEPSLEKTYVSPRWSPDGRQIAWVEHAEGRWQLMLHDLESRSAQRLDVAEGALVSQPAWAGPDALYASVGIGGFIGIDRFDLASGSSRTIVRSLGATFAPAPVRDESALYFLDIDADGLDIRRIETPSSLAGLEPPSIDPGFAPAVRPPTPAPPPLLEARDVPEPEPYGIGRQELRIQTGGGWFPSSRNLEIGLRAGDVVGRLNTLLIAELGGTGDETGYSLASAWRGWPVGIRGHIYSAEHELSRQPGCDAALEVCQNAAFDFERHGGELALFWSTQAGRTMRIWTEAGAIIEELETGGSKADREIFFVGVEPRIRRSLGRTKVGLDLQLRRESLGGDSEASSRDLIGAGALLGHGDLVLSVATLRGSADGAAGSPHERFALGGSGGSIIPRSALSSRIVSPALPIGVAFGEEYEGGKASLDFGGPLRAFYERHRLWDGGEPKGEWTELAGLETVVEIEPFPLLRLPGMALRLGVAQILTGPLEDDVQWWIGTTLRP